MHTCQRDTCLVLGAVDHNRQHVVAEHIVGDDWGQRGDGYQDRHTVEVMGIVHHPKHLRQVLRLSGSVGNT